MGPETELEEEQVALEEVDAALEKEELLEDQLEVSVGGDPQQLRSKVHRRFLLLLLGLSSWIGRDRQQRQQLEQQLLLHSGPLEHRAAP